MIRSTWIGALVVGTACTVAGLGQSLQPERFITVREAGKPAQKCRVLKVWTQPDGSQVAQVKAVESGEVMTILEEKARPYAPGRNTVATTKVYHWEGGKPPAGAPPIPATAREVGTSKTESKPSMLARLFGTSRTTTTTPVTPAPERMQARAEIKPTPAPAQPVVKATVTAPQPGDWRQSWGKVERWTADDSQKALAQASASHPQSARPAPPLARPRPDDPLRPDSYVQARPVTPAPKPSTPPTRLQPVAKETTPRVVAKAATPAVQRPAPAETRGLWARLTGSTSTPSAPMTAKPAVNKVGGDTPPGMASVLAAHSPQLAQEDAPAGLRGLPSMPPVPPPSVPVGTPNAFTLTVPANGGMVMDSGVPSGMGNAWTMAGSHRPVPAEMGMVPPHVANAFHNPGMPMPPMMGMPPMPPQMMQRPTMGMMPVAYYPPPAYYHGQVMPAGPVEPNVRQLVATLRDAMLPSEREMAADQLSRRDWKAEPEVVHALVQGAKADPAPLVRAACVRALGTMRVNTVPVVQAVQSLKTDGDLRVREAAEQTLKTLLAP